jgi:hypothetical protein
VTNLEARRLTVGEMVELNGKVGIIQRIENNSLVISWWLTPGHFRANESIIPYNDPLIAALERPRASGAM